MYKEKILMDALKQIEAGASPSNDREAYSWIGTAKEIASAALASCAEQAPPERSACLDKEEVLRDVKDIYAQSHHYKDWDNMWQNRGFNETDTDSSAIMAMDEWAKIKTLEGQVTGNDSDELEHLRRWKKEATEVYAPIHEYAQHHPDIKWGASMVAFVVDRAKLYDKMQGQVTGKSAVQPTTEQLRDELDDKRVLRFSNLTEDIWHLVRKQSAEHLLDKYDIFPKGEAGKQPEQQPADGVRIQELSLMVYTLSKVLAKKTCTQSEQKMIDGADEYLRKHFKPADVLRVQSEVSGEQKGGEA